MADLLLAASWLSLAAFGVAAYFAYRLLGETRGERYWPWIFVAVLAMAAHHATEIPWRSGLISHEVHEAFQKITEVASALALAYATYGLYRSMRSIREKLRDA